MNIKPWRTDLKRWLELPPQVSGDRIYSTSRHHQVTAVDADSGDLLWKADCSDQLLEPLKMAGEDTVLLRGREEESGSYVALDKSTGETRWSRTFSPNWKTTGTVLKNGTVLFRRNSLTGDESEPMLTALSPQSGKTLWSVPAQGRSWGVPYSDEADRVFLTVRGKGEEKLLAFDGNTGESLWALETDVQGRPQPMGNKLLVAGDHGLTAHNSQTGETVWSRGQKSLNVPVVTGRSVVVTEKRTDGVPGDRLIGLDRETGETKWHYDAPHLTGVAPGPEGQILHHAYKFDQAGVRNSYVHALDEETGEPRWSLEVGPRTVDSVGVDPEGRVVAALEYGRDNELMVAQNGKELWRRPVEGIGAAVVSNGESMVLFDSQGMTMVDAATGAYQNQVSVNSPLVNYSGEVGSDGRLAISGIDGELAGMTLPGAQPVLGPTEKTPGSMRHYRYPIAENEKGHYYADVKEDGQFIAGQDALLVRNVERVDTENPLSLENLLEFDTDQDGYLSRSEMNRASISLWWDRNLDGEMSRGDGLVDMAGEGRRQAVVDLERQKLEVRVKR